MYVQFYKKLPKCFLKCNCTPSPAMYEFQLLHRFTNTWYCQSLNCRWRFFYGGWVDRLDFRIVLDSQTSLKDRTENSGASFAQLYPMLPSYSTIVYLSQLRDWRWHYTSSPSTVSNRILPVFSLMAFLWPRRPHWVRPQSLQSVALSPSFLVFNAFSVLKSTGQIFHGMSINLSLSQLFLWFSWGDRIWRKNTPEVKCPSR